MLVFAQLVVAETLLVTAIILVIMLVDRAVAMARHGWWLEAGFLAFCAGCTGAWAGVLLWLIFPVPLLAP
jgi:hypothetical protein